MERNVRGELHCEKCLEKPKVKYPICVLKLQAIEKEFIKNHKKTCKGEIKTEQTLFTRRIL